MRREVRFSESGGRASIEKKSTSRVSMLGVGVPLRMLHEKIDHLILNEQQEVLEIHKVQIEMMNDILKRIDK